MLLIVLHSYQTVNLISREDFEKIAPKSQKQDISQPPPPPPPSLKVSSMPNRGRGRKHEVLVLKLNYSNLNYISPCHLGATILSSHENGSD